MKIRSIAFLGVSACVVPADGLVMPPETSSPPATVEATVRPIEPEAGPGCADGRDNDHDGRIDCEEASCAASPGCVEVCGNGVDDDNNGLTDGRDEQCWMALSTTPRVTARTVDGGDLLQQWDFVKDVYIRGGAWNLQTSSTRTLHLDSASGTARVTTAAAGVFTCTWGASGIDFGWDVYQHDWGRSSTYFWASSSSPIPVTRAASWVDSGCPLSAASFLPTTLQTTAPGHFGALRSGALLGRRWYVAAFPYFADQFTSVHSDDSWGHSTRTEYHSSVTGNLGGGDSVLLVP